MYKTCFQQFLFNQAAQHFNKEKSKNHKNHFDFIQSSYSHPILCPGRLLHNN